MNEALKRKLELVLLRAKNIQSEIEGIMEYLDEDYEDFGDSEVFIVERAFDRIEREANDGYKQCQELYDYLEEEDE